MIKGDHPISDRFVKLLSVTICFSLFFNQILFAHLPATSIWAERNHRPLLRQNVDAPSLFPTQSSAKSKTTLSQFGTVRETFHGTTTTPLLIIQDIHLNQEAQGNIVKMLRQLQAEKNLGMVGVEGAFVPFDFKPFFDAGDQKV